MIDKAIIIIVGIKILLFLKLEKSKMSLIIEGSLDSIFWKYPSSRSAIIVIASPGCKG